MAGFTALSSRRLMRRGAVERFPCRRRLVPVWCHWNVSRCQRRRSAPAGGASPISSMRGSRGRSAVRATVCSKGVRPCAAPGRTGFAMEPPPRAEDRPSNPIFVPASATPLSTRLFWMAPGLGGRPFCVVTASRSMMHASRPWLLPVIPPSHVVRPRSPSTGQHPLQLVVRLVRPRPPPPPWPRP